MAMNVKSIRVRNFKGVEDFEKEFNGGVYFFRGENEVGKSTLMDAIVTGLTGERSDNLLKKGAKDGEIVLKVGGKKPEVEVKLAFSKTNPRGKITLKKDGFTSSSKSVLQSIFQYEEIDAQKFIALSESKPGRREQVDVIRKMLPAKVRETIDRINQDIAKRKESAAGKTAQKNALAKQIETTGKGIPPLITDEMKEVKSVTKLTSELQELTKEQNDYQTAVIGYQNLVEKTEQKRKAKIEAENSAEIRISRINDEIAALKKRMQNEIKEMEKNTLLAEEDIAVFESRIKEADKWFKTNPEPDPEKVILKNKEIADVEDHNETAVKINNFLSLENQLELIKEEIENNNTEVRALEDEKTDALNSAKLGIKGLTFDDDGLYLNGIPFKTGEVSTSQEMEVAFRVINALNKTTKVGFLGRGESLGSEKMKYIVEFAKKHKLQLFIEEVVRDQRELTVEEYEVTE